MGLLYLSPLPLTSAVFTDQSEWWILQSYKMFPVMILRDLLHDEIVLISATRTQPCLGKMKGAND
jgi:hypothetical protein